ncbi:MAG: FAD-dependent oxidoreductase [Lentisphaeria bacterium]|nr:FAD-dependent oxidoreductase [Lentisphaeria bacterium]
MNKTKENQTQTTSNKIQDTPQMKSNGGLSRRGFLKGAVTVGGAGAAGLVGSSALVGLGVQTADAATGKARGAKADNSIYPQAEPIPKLSVPAKWDYQVDVVVAGGGGAGLAAAVAAAQRGAKVVVLEKNAFCGGDTSIAMVFSGNVGSRLQQKLGIKTPSLADRVMNVGYNNLVTPNPTCGRDGTMVRQITEYQADTIHWLEDLGVVFSTQRVLGLPAPGILHCPIDPEHPKEDWYYWHPHTARGFTEALEKKAKALGVLILKEHPATGLITSGKRVVGIAARNIDGKTVHTKAKAVILATGGFGANMDMLKKYCQPRRVEGARYWGMPGATGDGIRMAQPLGAALRQMEEVEIWDGGAVRELGATGVYTAPNQLVRQKSLTVNKKGKRFFNESLYKGYLYSFQSAQTIYQPGLVSFTVFDSNIISKEDIISKLGATFCEYPCPWFEKQFDEYLAKGVIKKADTLPELAKMLGIDPDGLVKTVKRYNELCDKGEDTDFFKEAKFMHPIRKPPFYGVGQKGGSLFNTYGGLVVDEKFHVLDEEWDPIPGLFVAGENAAGGASVAYGITMGRLTGEFASGEVIG